MLHTPCKAHDFPKKCYKNVMYLLYDNIHEAVYPWRLDCMRTSRPGVADIK